MRERECAWLTCSVRLRMWDQQDSCTNIKYESISFLGGFPCYGSLQLPHPIFGSYQVRLITTSWNDTLQITRMHWWCRHSIACYRHIIGSVCKDSPKSDGFRPPSNNVCKPFGAETLRLPAKFWVEKPRAVLLRDDTDVSATRHVLVLVSPLRVSASQTAIFKILFWNRRLNTDMTQTVGGQDHPTQLKFYSTAFPYCLLWKCWRVHDFSSRLCHFYPAMKCIFLFLWLFILSALVDSTEANLARCWLRPSLSQGWHIACRRHCGDNL